MKARPNRASLQTQDLPDLLVCEPLDIAQHQDGAVLGREAKQLPLNQAPQICLLNDPIGPRRGIGNPVHRMPGIAFGRQRPAGPLGRGPAPSRLQLVQAVVRSDPVEPCRKG